MLETILSVLGSGAAGGILGMAGNYLKSREDRKLKELEMNHDIKMEELTQASMKLEAELRVQEIDLQNQGKAKLANIEAMRAVDVAEASLHQASYEHDKSSYGGGFVDIIRGLTRPVLTTGSLIFLCFIFIQLTNMLGGFSEMDPDFLKELYKRVIMATIFISTTAVTWWFGSRPNKVRKDV